MGCIIHFRRPGDVNCVSSLFIEHEDTKATQIRHLKAIGYAVIDPMSATDRKPPMEQPARNLSLQQVFGPRLSESRF